VNALPGSASTRSNDKVNSRPGNQKGESPFVVIRDPDLTNPPPADAA
jgi:hypothetical protein